MKIKYIKVPEVYFVGEETWEELSTKFGFSVQVLKSYNKLEKIKKGSILALPFSDDVNSQNFEEFQEKYYIVKPADTLEKISQKVGVSVFALKQKNNVERVFIGQRLIY